MVQPDIGGINTGRIEQLSSYGARLAEARDVPFISLYRHAIYPLFKRHSDPKLRILIPPKLVIEAIGNTANEWTMALTSLTHLNGLRCCSMLPFHGALAARRLTTVGRRWCPQCLEEMADRSDVYEPLVWRLSEVVVCPYHGRRLDDRCARCDKGEQSSLAANARVGCCRHCGSWLGTSETSDDAGISDFEIFCAKACEELLLLPQTLDEGEEILPSHLAASGLRDVFFCGNGSAMGRRLGEIASQMNAYTNNELPTPLHVFLRAAYITGASVRQILVTQLFDSEMSGSEDIEFPLRRARSRASYQQELVDERLRHAAAGAGEVSVRQIASALNLEPVTLWRRSGELARVVAKKHASYIAQQAAQKKAVFMAEVRTLAERYRSAGVVATSKDIKQELNDAGCGINPWKRSVIDEILTEIFPSKESIVRRRP